MAYATGSAGLAITVRGSSRRIKIMRFRPANIRVINRRQNLPRLLLALSLKDDKNKDTAPIDVQKLTGHSISVLRGAVDGVNDHDGDGAFGGFELESKLFFDSSEDTGTGRF